MPEEENIVRERHGHIDQTLRTALSAGLQLTEQRARRHQQAAETERQLALEAARQLKERTRAEREANALLIQQSIGAEEVVRAADARKSAESATETASRQDRTAFPTALVETLAQRNQHPAEHSAAGHTAMAHQERQRSTCISTADLGR
jgi:hypothetical protein